VAEEEEEEEGEEEDEEEDEEEEVEEEDEEEKEEEIQRQWSACSQHPPCLGPRGLEKLVRLRVVLERLLPGSYTRALFSST
jgi:hypothetical protein